MATYYVATTGSDAAEGSETAPWETIDGNFATLTAGDALLLYAGTYNRSHVLSHTGGAATITIKPRGDGPVYISNYTSLASNRYCTKRIRLTLTCTKSYVPGSAVPSPCRITFGISSI
jgi:hypothetical protein